MNIPELRFANFADIWKDYKMIDLYSFKVTNSFSRDDLNYNVGSVKNIHYGDIHTKFQTLFDIRKENVPYINLEISIKRIAEDNYCQEGDLIIADASEDLNDVGKSIEIFYTNNEKILAGLHTILARPTLDKLSVGFGGYLFKSNRIRSQIQKESQGSKVLSISSTRISNIDITLPSKNEQAKISSFFAIIDEKLQFLKKKHNHLDQYRKGVMQAIFSKNLRFRDENGNDFPEWEEKNGNLIFENIVDRNHNSDLPILAITQEYGAIPRSLIDYTVSVTDKSIESYKVVQVGDFIISLRSFQGGIEYSYYKGICSPAYIILRSIIPVDNLFYKFYFKTDNYINKLQKNLEGIRDGKMISYKYFSEIKLPYPSKQEQAKVANYLSKLDEKVNCVQTQIEKIEAWKSGLLQKMFC